MICKLKFRIYPFLITNLNPYGETIMNQSDLKKRTKQFALRVIRLVDALPNSIPGRAIGNQLMRSGTSVGANYRSACRGRSTAEFIAKLGIALEESEYWLELIIEAQLLKNIKVESLLAEAGELTAIFVTTLKSAKANK
jgi:four helix bundle protein